MGRGAGVQAGKATAQCVGSQRAARGRPGAVTPPTGAKWYGPQGRGPGHVTRPRPPFCSAVLVFRAQRLTARIAFPAV